MTIYNCTLLNKCRALSEGLAWPLGTTFKQGLLYRGCTCVKTIACWYWVKDYSGCVKSQPIAIRHESDEG